MAFRRSGVRLPLAPPALGEHFESLCAVHRDWRPAFRSPIMAPSRTGGNIVQEKRPGTGVEVSSETRAILASISTDTITGLLIKIADLRTRAIRGVRPLNPERCRFVGPAYTIRYVPVREDLTEHSSLASPTSHLRGTLDAIPAGSVLVIDMMRDGSSGALGDVLIARLIAIGVAGIVADGGMRDVSVLAGMAMPIFCAGPAAPPSTRSLLCADVQTMIGCGGVMVVPGDIVVADGDGVAVIPRHLATEVAQKGAEQERIEAWIKREVERGAPVAGLYPPGEESRARYHAWVAAGSPD
jgi:regulator of RNase E activity RraA